MSQSTNQSATIGLIQMHCENDPKKNLKKALDRIQQAAQKGAQIICLQELFKSLYFCQKNDHQYFSLADPVPGPLTQKLSDTAKKMNIVLIASVFEQAEYEKYYNTALVFDTDGKIKGHYRKIHVPDDLKNHYSEKYYFEPGNLKPMAVQTKYGKIGVLICWDQWFPEPARQLALDGAEIIFYPTAIGWPNKEKKSKKERQEFDAWITIQRSHSIANGVFVAATNRLGLEDHIDFWGSSFVSDPFGSILKQASIDKEEILITKINLNNIKKIREDWPFLKSQRVGYL